mgnify:CR=1 FL=1
MKHTALHRLMILTLTGLPLTSLAEEAAPVLQCYPKIQLPDRLATLNKNDDSVRIYSGSVDLIDNKSAKFFNGVELTHRDTLLSAPSASFDKSAQTMFADGGISYYSPVLKVSSSSFKAQMGDSSATMTDAEYRFTQQAGRGYAQELKADDQKVALQMASFTTCPDGDDGWSLQADKIQLNADDGWGEAWHSVVKIKDVPVLYVPYMTFPVSDKRKSGLLVPKIGSSKKLGVDVQLPYYFNIAENFDATLTPRLMSLRGTQLKNEVRYLTEEHQGKLQVEYLAKDQEKPNDFGSRYLSHLTHQSDFTDQWRAQIDFTDVSDDSYISDLGSDYANQSDTQLYRKFALNYYGDQVNSSIQLQGFEILGDHLESYHALPQWDLQSAQPSQVFGDIEFSWRSQYSHFEHNSARVLQADRLHFEPTLSLPYSSPALDLLFETSMLTTYYQQKINADFAPDQVSYLDKNVQRSLPVVQANGKLNFERETSWFGQNSLQTLEPQIQYVYIPYRDQTNINFYDTARLQDDYYGLFRQNRFSGLDRINDANQITLGATTRVYDAKDTERFRFSLGQILFLADPQGIDANNPEDVAATESILAAEALVHWQNRWFINSGFQFDADTNRMIKSNVTLDYRADDKKLFQLNHRYSRNVSNNVITQLGALGTMPVADQWQLVTSYYRDLENDRMVEANFGLQYESCCWAVRLVARRQVETNFSTQIDNIDQPVELDSGIALQFVLKGFGDSAGFDVSDMLSSGVFGYRRPYLLNN